MTTEELPKISPNIVIETQTTTGTLKAVRSTYTMQADGVFSRTNDRSDGDYQGGGKSHDSTVTLQYSHNHNATMEPIGNNLLHENQPPFEVIYRWKRIA